MSLNDGLPVPTIGQRCALDAELPPGPHRAKRLDVSDYDQWQYAGKVRKAVPEMLAQGDSSWMSLPEPHMDDDYGMPKGVVVALTARQYDELMEFAQYTGDCLAEIMRRALIRHMQYSPVPRAWRLSRRDDRRVDYVSHSATGRVTRID